MNSWYYGSGKDSDTVLSSRIRLARNLADYPFSSKLSLTQLSEIKLKVKNAVLSDNKYGKILKYIEMENVPKTEIMAMVERHLISPDFALNCKNKAIIVSEDETVCIMIGEEDHIRIQVIFPGNDLDGAYAVANEIDSVIIGKEKMAFDSELGFLTECPTNIGTGLRASVMLHLPLLERKGLLHTFSDSLGKVGFTVRGLYGEGTSSKASVCQVSNQITLGITERNAIDNLKEITGQLIERERNERKNFDVNDMEDTVFRAYGILKYQRKIGSEEMMKLLSDLKLGTALDIINIDKSLPFRLFVELQPNMLEKKFGEMSAQERDIKRAEELRIYLKGK